MNSPTSSTVAPAEAGQMEGLPERCARSEQGPVIERIARELGEAASGEPEGRS